MLEADLKNLLNTALKDKKLELPSDVTEQILKFTKDYLAIYMGEMAELLTKLRHDSRLSQEDILQILEEYIEKKIASLSVYQVLFTVFFGSPEQK